MVPMLQRRDSKTFAKTWTVWSPYSQPSSLFQRKLIYKKLNFLTLEIFLGLKRFNLQKFKRTLPFSKQLWFLLMFSFCQNRTHSFINKFLKYKTSIEFYFSCLLIVFHIKISITTKIRFFLYSNFFQKLSEFPSQKS